MLRNSNIVAARFGMGQKIRHKLFGYRGIVLDVDSSFQMSDDWYKKMTKTQPSKDEPWYHVLVHDSSQVTYVAQENMEIDVSDANIEHPVIDLCFDVDAKGHYQRRMSVQ